MPGGILRPLAWSRPAATVPGGRLRPLLLAALLLPAGCALQPAPSARGPAPGPEPLPLAAEAWVQQSLAAMSLEQRVGQLLMLDLPGGFDNLRGPVMRDFERVLAATHAGSVRIAAGSPLEVALKLNEVQQRSPLPLLVAADPDTGWSTGQGGFTAFPYNMGIAAAGDPGLAELHGRIAAIEARAMGIHWLFAPVADVHSVIDNPVLNVRSYGSDAGTVATYATAFIRGAQGAGVLATARHFPGQGATRVDPAAGLPVLNSDWTLLEQRELQPFRAAIGSGVAAVMLGHIAVPALTGGFTSPASVSPQIATDLLRNSLGFDGIILTDAMNLAAVRTIAGYSPAELVVRAVQAGADVVLAPPDAQVAHAALVAAVRSGRLHYSRIDSSAARVLRAKARLGLHHRRTVALDSVARVVRAPEHDIVAAHAAGRTLTLARDSALLLPLDPRRVRSIVAVAVSARDDVRAGALFADELTRIYGRAVTFVRIDDRTAPYVHDSVARAARRADATILATFLAPVTARQNGASYAAARALAARLHSDARRLVVVAFGDPFLTATLPGASTFLLAWHSAGEATARAAARAIAGQVPIPGRLAVELPRDTVVRGLTRDAAEYGLRLAAPEEVGMDGRALARVDSIIGAALVSGAAAGAALAVGRYGRLVRLRGYGTLDRQRGFPAVTDSTIYDLASVTKVVATTTALMMLYDDGLISLDDPVRHHLPEWRGTPAKESVTIRHLLMHNSGLAAYGPLWRELQGRQQYRRRIAAMNLEYEPGSRTLYSDFGIILLGLIIEQVSGQTLDVFLGERLFRPLGMRDTGFNPLQWPYGPGFFIDQDGAHNLPVPDAVLVRIAPTEVDTLFRKRHLRGEVHDENAFAMGGVAGHAGLFSSARDMAVFAQLMLNRGFLAGRRFIDPATVELFTRRQSEASTRALGWETAAGSSSAGSYFSAASYGHTGFTGTSIWIDPEKELFVVLLTNRVNPTRDNQLHVPLRRDIADAVQRAIVDVPAVPR
jgi:CubicO group peptidase (beta-lactamase class C family)/beta-glucosidase-like glycosyl hydrolase